MSHADRSDDVVHMLYGEAGMEDTVAKWSSPLVKLNRAQKKALKGLPKPGWFVRQKWFLSELDRLAEYDELLEHAYIVEHYNMFDQHPDVGITSRGLRAIKKKKKAP